MNEKKTMWLFYFFIFFGFLLRGAARSRLGGRGGAENESRRGAHGDVDPAGRRARRRPRRRSRRRRRERSVEKPLSRLSFLTCKVDS